MKGILGSTKRLTTNEFIHRIELKHGVDKFDFSKTNYISKRSPVTIICKQHGPWVSEARTVLKSKFGCPRCFQEFRIQRISYTPEEFQIKAKLVWDNYYLYPPDCFKGVNQKVKVICPEHGIFEQFVQNHLKGFVGCNLCSCSGGELQIQRFLEKYQIQFVREKIFPNCIDKAPLPCDFFLPDYNYCIEFDGIHHFEPIWGQKRLELQRKHDQIKNDFCRDNSIGLLRISHLENIPEKLLNFTANPSII